MSSKRFLTVMTLLILAAIMSACGGARTPVAAVQQEADEVVEAPGMTPEAAEEEAARMKSEAEEGRRRIEEELNQRQAEAGLRLLAALRVAGFLRAGARLPLP